MASEAAIVARSEFKPLHGVGAIIYRISSKKQEIKSQYEGVANWLLRRKATVDPVNVFDFVVKRRKTTDHFDFKRFIDWVKAGRINWVVVQDLDRFGSKNPNELMGFLGQLRDDGCQLWTVADDMCMNDGTDAAVLMSCIKGMTSEKECWIKSDRAHRTKQDMTLDGKCLGGPIPYGFDVECRRDGKAIWRYVLDRAIKVEEVDHRGHKTKSYVFRGVVMEDDRETEVNAIPARNRKIGETAWLVESIRAERKEALALIFDMYVNGEATPYAIAKTLNARGYNPVHGETWYPEKVKHILANPVYQGKPSAYKKTHSGYYRYAGIDEETGSRIMGKAPDRAGKLASYDRSEWIGPKVDPFQPLVDPEIVQASIDKRFAPIKRAKAPKNASLWLSGLVVCDRCGKPMTGNAGYPDPKRKKIHRTYMCANYIKYSGEHCPTGCKAHRTQHDVIERYLTTYFETQAKTLDDYKTSHHNPEKLQSLLRRNDEVLGMVVEYMNRMAKLVCNVQGSDGPNPPYHRGDFEEILADLPTLLVCYEEAIEARRGKLTEIIQAKEAEFDRMVEGFQGLDKSNDRAIQTANAKLKAIDEEIKGLQAELPSLETRVYSLFDELSDLGNRIGEARLAMQIGSDQSKAEAVRKAIKEIRLTFRYESHSAREWSKVKTVTIVPRIGQPATFEVEGLPSAGREKRDCVSKENTATSGSSPTSTSTTASPTS